MRNNDEIHDRGMIKWAPYKSLKEFDVALKKMYANRELKPKPKLSTDAVNEILYVLLEAVHENKKIQITFWLSGEYHTIEGEITKIDDQTHRISFNSTDSKVIEVIISNIIHAEIL